MKSEDNNPQYLSRVNQDTTTQCSEMKFRVRIIAKISAELVVRDITEASFCHTL